MSEMAAETRRRAPFLPSVIAAASLPIWIFSTGVLFGALDGLIQVSDFSTYFGRTLGQLFSISSVPTLAFAAGTLLSIWLVAPIVGGLGVRGVVVRAVVAAAVSAIALFPAHLVYTLDLIHQINEQNSAQSPGLVQVVPVGDDEAVARSIVETLRYSIARIPLIALAALGSWAWQRRSLNGKA